MKFQAVMVVDDDEGDQFLAKMQLLRFNPELEVLQAFDGLEALQLLEDPSCVPDLILLDINMPRMNGHEFLAEYSKRDNPAEVVVMLTSSAQKVDKDNALKYACTKDYIEKSLDRMDIDRIVEI